MLNAFGAINVFKYKSIREEKSFIPKNKFFCSLTRYLSFITKINTFHLKWFICKKVAGACSRKERKRKKKIIDPRSKSGELEEM